MLSAGETDIQNKEKPKRFDFKLPAISTESASYVILYPPNSKQGNEAATRFKTSLKKMEEYYRYFDNKVNSQKIKFYNYQINLELPNINPIARYCALKLERMDNKLQLLYHKLYEKGRDISSEVISFLKQCKSSGSISVVCKYQEFWKSMNSSIQNNQYLDKYRIRIQRLNNYALTLKKFKQIPDVSINEIHVQLEIASKNFIPFIDYCPPSAFDQIFYDYICCNNMLSYFDKIISKIASDPRISNPKTQTHFSLPKAQFSSSPSLGSFSSQEELSESVILKKPKEIPKKKYTIDLADLVELMKLFLKKLSIKSNSLQSVVNCSIIRIFFDRLYIVKPSILKSDDETYFFAEKCALLKSSTPYDMSIPTTLIKEEFSNVPCSIIYTNSPIMKDALNDLEMIQFLTNPIDIIYNVFDSLKCVEVFSEKNRLEQKYGIFASMFSGAKNEKSNLSFDDIFALFISVVANSYPANYESVCSLLEAIRNLKFSSHLEFAKNLLESAYNYISEMNVNDLFRQPNDHRDPLNLMVVASNDAEESII